MMVRILVLLQAFFILETLKEVAAENHRCYVCIPKIGSSISDVVRMFPGGTFLPFCNRFDIDDPIYVRECPSPNHQGCLTQTNGTHVTKTCTEYGIEDCKTANKIKYCYCRGELCNGESVPTEAPLPPTTDDDEDSPSEGSGSPEASDGSQLETSSEIDVNIEVIRIKLPTTTKYVVLTTPRPDGGSSTASTDILAHNLTFFYTLIICAVHFYPRN